MSGSRRRSWARARDTVNFSSEGLRRLEPRGRLDVALAPDDGRTRDVRDGPDASRLDRTAPESPRPREMLEHVAVVGEDTLTASDMTLHELLVSYAYEKSKRRMDKADYVMPTAYALRLLGENARRKGLRESLKRLRSTVVRFGLAGGRRFEDVPMICSWVEGENGRDEIRYVIPNPICVLMESQLVYAYIELGALASMQSRYGVRLYRHLALEMAQARWKPGLENVHEITVSVEDMKAWLGFEGDHIGQLQLRALKPALADLVHVRRFCHVKTDNKIGCEAIKGKRRGGGIDGWKIRLRLNPPAAHHGMMQPVAKEARGSVGGVDIPRFQARQDFWQRKGQFLREHGYIQGFVQAFHVWLLAVDEALTGRLVTNGFHGRRMRGERLLAAVDALGPEQAAAELLAEEVEAPDLLVLPEETTARRERLVRIREAGRARFHRYKDREEGAARRRRSDDAVPATKIEDVAVEANVVPVAPAPASGPIRKVEFFLHKGVAEVDAEQLFDRMDTMTFSGDEDAPVQIDVRIWQGLGYVTFSAGQPPAAEADILLLAREYGNMIEDWRVER